MTAKSVESRTILITYLAFAGIGLAGGLLGVAWPYMQQDFHLALDAVNVLLLVQTGAYTIASFFIGRVMTRFGSGTTLLAGTLVLALCTFGIATSSAWVLVVAFGLIGGFGNGTIDAGMNMYVTTYHSARQMNWLHASFGLGVTFGPLIMTYCALHLTWHIGYVITGVVLTVIMALLFVTRSLWRNEGFQTAENKPVRRATFVQSLRAPVLWYSMVTFLAYVGLEIAVGLWAFTLLKDSRGFKPEDAGLWVGIYWGVFTGGRIFFGLIVNRFDTGRLLRWCLLAVVAGTVLFWWNPLPLIGSIGLIITGFAEAPIFPMLMMMTPQRVGMEHAENAISLQMGFVGVGAAILPGMIGTIGKNFGLEAMTVVFVVLAVITFVFYELTRLPQPERPALSSAGD